MRLVIVFQAAHFLMAVGYGGQHVSNVEQLIVVVTMVLAAVLFFLLPNSLGIEIFEIFYFGEENYVLSCGFY